MKVSSIVVSKQFFSLVFLNSVISFMIFSKASTCLCLWDLGGNLQTLRIAEEIGMPLLFVWGPLNHT